ncbi:MAG: 2-oxo acid dehydrogenase subunit E2 [Candidatus Binatia bacterium]
MSATEPIVVPRENVNDDSVYLIDWLVADGTRVEAGTPVCTIETSKANVDVDAPVAGFVRHQRCKGDEVPVGGVLGYLTATADGVLPTEARAIAAPTAPGAGETVISGKARQKMAELGLDPSLFAGRGVVKEKDVVEMAARAASVAAPAAADARGPSTVTPLSPVQRRTARVMEESVAAIPSSYLEREIDFAALRARAQALAQESGAVVTELDLLVAGVARACARFPRFNAALEDGYQLRAFAQANVGVAMDLEGELYVPVLRDAGTKGAVEIAKALRGLLYLTQRHRLEAQQLTGGTITVTSMIGRGVRRFIPIPYPRQSAIVGIGDPAGDRAALCVVFDHRVANGSEAAAFLGAIEELARGA